MFKYKVRRPPVKPIPLGKITEESRDEVLSGYVQGTKASDIEERFARALTKDKRIDGFSFRFPIISPRNMPGQLEIDFVVVSGGTTYPFQVDGEYAHRNAAKKMDDMRRDIMVDEFMKKYSAMPIKRIDGRALKTQDEADRMIRELIR